MIQRLLIAVLFAAASTTDWDKGEKLCDDGTYLVEKDLGDTQNWHCAGNDIVIKTFYTPSGNSSCHDDAAQASFVCMEGGNITYSDTPPSSGKMRLQAPMYGEYQYLPPQRWLRALQYGAVAFLYHPCAPAEQVVTLRDLAQTCLWKHVITPYNGLSPEYPFALVVWGCVYRMTWVNRVEAADWIRSHALQTPLSAISSNGIYKTGLLHNATVVPSDVICPGPKPISVHPTKGPDIKEGVTTHLVTVAQLATSCDPTCPTPTSQPHKVQHFSFQTFLVYALFVFLVGVLMAILAVVVMYVAQGYRASKKGHPKYKPASSFFSLGTGGQDKSVRVSIPEVGLPSPMPNEREILLNDDSEEEL